MKLTNIWLERDKFVLAKLDFLEANKTLLGSKDIERFKIFAEVEFWRDQYFGLAQKLEHSDKNEYSNQN